MFAFGRRNPRGMASLIPVQHERPNCTITFYKDSSSRIRHVVVELPGKNPVRVTPAQYKKWREIAVDAKKKGRISRQGLGNIAMGVAVTHPAALGKLLHVGKSMGGDILQAFIDVAMN
jgi:hypothetical protein